MNKNFWTTALLVMAMTLVFTLNGVIVSKFAIQRPEKILANLTTAAPINTAVTEIPSVAYSLLLSSFEAEGSHPEPDFSGVNLEDIYNYLDNDTTPAFTASRELSASEMDRCKELAKAFYAGEADPERQISTERLTGTVYFEMSENRFYFPDTDMTDEELLQIIEFVARVNYALSTRRVVIDEPASFEIKEQEAIDVGVSAIETLFLVETGDMQLNSAFMDLSPLSSQWMIRVAPYDIDTLVENGENYWEYTVFVDATSGKAVDAKASSSQYDNTPIPEDEMAGLSDNKALADAANEIVSDRFGDMRPIANTVILTSEEHDQLMKDNKVCTPTRDMSLGLVDVFVQMDDGSFYIVQFMHSTSMLKNLSYYGPEVGMIKL